MSTLFLHSIQHPEEVSGAFNQFTARALEAMVAHEKDAYRKFM